MLNFITFQVLEKVVKSQKSVISSREYFDTTFKFLFIYLIEINIPIVAGKNDFSW